MEIVMDTNSGKVLDEACNQYNDLYSDEVLYASWADVPPVEAGSAEVNIKAYSTSARTSVQSFMVRLSTRHG